MYSPGYRCGLFEYHQGFPEKCLPLSSFEGSNLVRISKLCFLVSGLPCEGSAITFLGGSFLFSSS
jgi:hypothetical protein